MTDPRISPPIAVVKCYDFTLELMQRIEKMPRSHRFTLGDRLAASVNRGGWLRLV